MINTRFIVILTLLFTLSINKTHAQLIKRRHAKGEVAPAFVLVQLPTEKRKIEWFTKSNNTALVAQAQKDAAGVTKAIVADFNDNFNFCPVYFYYDTNAPLVKSGRLDNILLDKDLKPTSSADTGKDFQIIIYTFGGSTTSDFNGTGAAVKDAGYNIGTSRTRLVAYDMNYDRVKAPAPDGADLITYIATRLGRKYPKYAYTSKRFNTYYRPYANQLSGQMKAFYVRNK